MIFKAIEGEGGGEGKEGGGGEEQEKQKNYNNEENPQGTCTKTKPLLEATGVQTSDGCVYRGKSVVSSDDAKYPFDTFNNPI